MLLYSELQSLPSQFIIHKHIVIQITHFFPCGSTAQFWALSASMQLSVLFRLLDLGQSEVLLGRLISSSQGLC
jgi:hypothetical protein